MIQVRRSVKEDCPRLLELITELAVYEKALNEVTVTLEHFTESGFGQKPVWWSFVAEENGVILGFALYYIRYSTWKGQRMYLEDIIVTEKARGKGIGKLLIPPLIDASKKMGMHTIIAGIDASNEASLKLHKSFGFEEVAHFKEVGWKFERWLDLKFLQLIV